MDGENVRWGMEFDELGGFKIPFTRTLYIGHCDYGIRTNRPRV